MAVAFTAQDKARIAASLLDTAEELFATQGLKKTSLDELVAPAGIAKGSFYAFYDSKEELYKEVMIRRAPLMGKLLAAALDRPPSAEALVALMRSMIEVLTTDPFYRRLITRPDELEAVARRVGAEEVARVTPHLLTPLIDYLARGQADGVIVADVAPEVLVGVLRTAGLLVLNRDRFGPDHEQVVEATINALARGLIA
ncbi:DNA-binding transcriptional regulator, AcrR family [Nonomuraea solani]|uniref:DNA-binding transcriptional regulator, AcrR family n=1 Tax=Nonomuraea solani TaxID=1144553 RepID=A0A1H6CXV1_9ACTN|nr:TetR/AcrR family transcriptional regulator [Nonomuraea solani]SEG77664.1 DNA-binding transcriptional regulator, AcrR family [Nonomuraea solani]